MDGFARNFAQGVASRTYRSVEGSRICEESNFAILHRLSRLPLTQGCATGRYFFRKDASNHCGWVNTHSLLYADLLISQT